VARAAEKVGLRLEGIASQDRPHFDARSSRAFAGSQHQEHLIHLRK
jgi:hypothetical protein